MIESNIVNVIATANLNQKLKLDELSKSGHILHDETIYGGRVGYFRSPQMRGEVTLFPSGKMISVGAKNENEATHQLEFVRDFLLESEIIEPVHLEPKIQNIVVVIDLEERIDLENMMFRFGMVYEPEQFPGGIMRFEEPPRATALIFSSGKVVVTGLKSACDIPKMIEKLKRMIEQDVN